MLDTWNSLLFGVYPYFVATVFIVANLIRYDREQYSWKAGSSQMLANKNFRLANNLFHIGVLFILAGHFVGLLTPASIYHHVISTANKQLVAMVSGGFFGVLCLVGMTMLLHRRLCNPRIRATSTFSDISILVMLYIQLILGLGTILVSSQHMDGSEMVQLATWAQSIVTFQMASATTAISHVPLIYKLHVFFGLTLLLAFPFTRLVHIISAPVWYLGRNYQIVRQKSSRWRAEKTNY